MSTNDDVASLRCSAMAPDDELIARCQRGEGSAWNEVVANYRNLVRSIARSYGLSAEDVDEVEQVVFSILVQQIERMQPDSRLAGWFGVVTRRHVWRLVARNRKSPQPREILDGDVVHADVDDHATRSHDVEWVRTALDALPPRCRDLLEVLFADESLGYAEVAVRLDIPVGSIGPTRQRCLERLRDLLEASVDTADVGTR